MRETWPGRALFISLFVSVPPGEVNLRVHPRKNINSGASFTTHIVILWAFDIVVHCRATAAQKSFPKDFSGIFMYTLSVVICINIHTRDSRVAPVVKYLARR